MTLRELKSLRRYDRVSLSGDGVPDLWGVVTSASPGGVCVLWDDGYETTIIFRHLECRRDTRHERMEVVSRARG